jgi:hypothetical protein
MGIAGITTGKLAPSDNSFARLHDVGWTVGNVAVHGGFGVVWTVTGSNGENRIEARGSTQLEAWHNALLQAAAVGWRASFATPKAVYEICAESHQG